MTSPLLQHLPSLGLAGILLLTAPLGLAQDAAPTSAPIVRPALKGASSPLQAAQQQNLPPAPIPPPAPIRPPTPIPPPIRPNQEKPAEASKTPALKPGEVLLNFQAADIQGVVKAVGQMTGRNFLLDPRVKGQITIISSRPVTTSAAYQIFLSALKAQGFTAVEGIGAIKIVPTTEAKTNAEVNMEGEPRGGERIVTHVMVVQHTSATQMIPLLRPLMSPTSQLSAYDQANALIITDYADNIRRMLRIIEKIDQPVSSDVTIIPLKYASALDMSELVMRLAQPGTGQPGVPQAAVGAGDRLTIIPDLRTNSLLVRADNPGRVSQVQSLIAKLDVPALSSGQTRVIYLRNADAVKLAEVLRGLLAGEARSQTAAATPTTAGAVRPVGAGASGRAAEASLIQADEATNALIINAPDAVYNNLRGVIEKLDVRRTQVYVEALIVEMTLDATKELGVQWAGGVPAGNGAVAAVQNFPGANPSLGVAVTNPTSLVASGGLLLGFLGERVTLPDGTVIRSLGALARALEQQSLANILSTPNLMTLDNAEAKIVVGQNVPFVTGSFSTTPSGTVGGGTNANPFQTIERKDIGVTLKIKPQVSEGGVIKLDIYQEVSNIAQATLLTGASDIITNKRSIETKVLVDDGHTIILGGLIDDNRQESEQSVPYLGKLPLVGWLFRYTQKTGKRTNLMVFLRPVIVGGPQESYNVTADRYKYLRAQTQGISDQNQRDVLDRLTPTPPTADELKRYRKRGNDSETPSESAAKPAAEAPAAATAAPEAPAAAKPAAETPAATKAVPEVPAAAKPADAAGSTTN
jgi:general secretion pathway protein D